ncbi:MAG: hypothetical protein ABSB60_04835 [Terracidiphilus sp.]
MTLLEKLFGPSKQEIWHKLCAEIGGNYVDGGFWKGDKVEATHGPWTITLDTYTVSNGKSSTTYTRMRAPYENSNGFRFTVYRKSIFSGIGKWFGMQDIEIGDPYFDSDFILKGNNEAKLRELLGDLRLRELIADQPDIHFSVKDDEGFFNSRFPDGVDELCFQVVGVIKDVEQLKLLFELFSETLDQLCRIGAAAQTDPNVSI